MPGPCVRVVRRRDRSHFGTAEMSVPRVRDLGNSEARDARAVQLLVLEVAGFRGMVPHPVRDFLPKRLVF